jgi:threonine/homoserine efflux transporter RhtA
MISMRHPWRARWLLAVGLAVLWRMGHHTSVYVLLAFFGGMCFAVYIQVRDRAVYVPGPINRDWND